MKNEKNGFLESLFSDFGQLSTLMVASTLRKGVMRISEITQMLRINAMVREVATTILALSLSILVFASSFLIFEVAFVAQTAVYATLIASGVLFICSAGFLFRYNSRRNIRRSLSLDEVSEHLEALLISAMQPRSEEKRSTHQSGSSNDLNERLDRLEEMVVLMAERKRTNQKLDRSFGGQKSSPASH